MTDPKGRIKCQWCGQWVHEIIILKDPSEKLWDVCANGGCGNRLMLNRGYFICVGVRSSGWYREVFKSKPVRFMGTPRPTDEELREYVNGILEGWKG